MEGRSGGAEGAGVGVGDGGGEGGVAERVAGFGEQDAAGLAVVAPQLEHLGERDVVEVQVVGAGVVGVVEALGLPRDADADVVAPEVTERSIVLGDAPPLGARVVLQQLVDGHER